MPPVQTRLWCSTVASVAEWMKHAPATRTLCEWDSAWAAPTGASAVLAAPEARAVPVVPTVAALVAPAAVDPMAVVVAIADAAGLAAGPQAVVASVADLPEDLAVVDAAIVDAATVVIEAGDRGEISRRSATASTVDAANGAAC
jgi:hypothetical protein